MGFINKKNTLFSKKSYNFFLDPRYDTLRKRALIIKNFFLAFHKWYAQMDIFMICPYNLGLFLFINSC